MNIPDAMEGDPRDTVNISLEMGWVELETFSQAMSSLFVSQVLNPLNATRFQSRELRVGANSSCGNTSTWQPKLNRGSWWVSHVGLRKQSHGKSVGVRVRILPFGKGSGGRMEDENQLKWSFGAMYAAVPTEPRRGKAPFPTNTHGHWPDLERGHRIYVTHSVEDVGSFIREIACCMCSSSDWFVPGCWCGVNGGNRCSGKAGMGSWHGSRLAVDTGVHLLH